MANSNAFSQVKILSNPVKSVVCHEKFSNREDSSKPRIFREQLDLTCGVWQVAVSHVLLINPNPYGKINTVFDLKTNLCSSYKLINSQPVLVNECLTSFDCQCEPGSYVMHSPNPKVFFTVQNTPGDHFELILAENELIRENQREHVPFQVIVEVRLLFQRMI